MSFIPVVTIDPGDRDTVFGKAIFLMAVGLLFATITAISYLIVFQPTEEGAFFKESQYGGTAALYNFAFMLVLVVTFTLIIYFMIKRGLFNILTILQGFLLGLISGSIGGLFITLWTIEILISLIYASVISPIDEQALINFVIIFQYLAFATLFIVTLITIVSAKYKRFRNFILIFTASVAGSYFGLSLGTLTPLILLVGFAIYDIIAVFKGPLKLISDELKNYMVEDEEAREKRGLIIGLGDVFFYSLAVGYTLAFLNVVAFILVVISLLVGYILTINIVLNEEKRRALPALPLPILFALTIIFFFTIM